MKKVYIVLLCLVAIVRVRAITYPASTTFTGNGAGLTNLVVTNISAFPQSSRYQVNAAGWATNAILVVTNGGGGLWFVNAQRMFFGSGTAPNQSASHSILYQNDFHSGDGGNTYAPEMQLSTPYCMALLPGYGATGYGCLQIGAGQVGSVAPHNFIYINADGSAAAGDTTISNWPANTAPSSFFAYATATNGANTAYFGTRAYFNTNTFFPSLRFYPQVTWLARAKPTTYEPGPNPALDIHNNSVEVFQNLKLDGSFTGYIPGTNLGTLGPVTPTGITYTRYEPATTTSNIIASVAANGGTVFAFYSQNISGNPNVAPSATFGGTAMTLITYTNAGPGAGLGYAAALFYLTNASGTANIVFTNNMSTGAAGGKIAGGAVVLTNVSYVNTNFVTMSPQDVSVNGLTNETATSVGDLVLDFCWVGQGGVMAANGGQSLVLSTTNGAGNPDLSCYSKPGYGYSITETFSLASKNGGLISVRVVPQVQIPNITGTFTGNGSGVTNVGLSASATLNFPSTSAGSFSELLISVPGALDGDPVILGVPAAATPSTLTGCYTAWSSNANVYVRFSNNALVTAQDPVSATFKVRVLH